MLPHTLLKLQSGNIRSNVEKKPTFSFLVMTSAIFLRSKDDKMTIDAWPLSSHALIKGYKLNVLHCKNILY